MRPTRCFFLSLFLCAMISTGEDKITFDDTTKIVEKVIAETPPLPVSRTKESIKRDIVKYNDSIQAAYKIRLNEKSDLAGVATVQFFIKEDGSVISANIEASTLNDTVFERQIVDFVKKFSFEKIGKPADTTVVVYPFAFNKELIIVKPEPPKPQQPKPVPPPAQKKEVKSVRPAAGQTNRYGYAKSPCTIVSGTRTQASVDKVVSNRSDGVKDLYKERAKEKRTISGKLRVNFTIDESGSVISVDILSNTLKDSVLTRQEIDYIKTWEFGRAETPGDITTVEYLMTFKNKRETVIFAVVIAAVLAVFLLRPYINF